MDLSVRPLAAEDFDVFINYWLGFSQADIDASESQSIAGSACD
jgi:hypothetical protein